MCPIPPTQTQEERSKFPASGPAPFCDAAWSSCGTGPAWPIGWMGNRSRPQRGRLALVRHHYIELATISSLNSSSLIDRHARLCRIRPRGVTGRMSERVISMQAPPNCEQVCRSHPIQFAVPILADDREVFTLVSRHEKTQTQLLQTGLDRRR